MEKKKFNGGNNYKKGGYHKDNRSNRPKPEYKKVMLSLGYSEYIEDQIDRVVDILNNVPFDKISIPVNMAKGILYDNPEVKGFVPVGNVVKFDGSVFTVSINARAEEKIDGGYVIGVRCTKNEDGEITFISSIYITKGEPMFPSEESDVEVAE